MECSRNLINSRKNIIWNSLGSTMFGAASFIMLLLVSRVADVDTVGAFGIALTNAQLLYIIGVFGANNYQMTDYQKRFSFSDYYWVKILTCTLMALFCVPFIIFGSDIQKTSFTLCLTAFMLLNAVGELYQSLFFQNRRVDLSGKSLFFRTFFSIVAFTLVIVLSQSIVAALSALLFVNILCTWFWGVRRAKQFISPKRSFNKRQIMTLLSECFPLFISMFLMTFLLSAPKYGIEMLLDDTAQGYFNMIFMPAQVINLCSQFFFKPMLYRYATLLESSDIRGFRHLLSRQIALIGAVVITACLFAYTLGPLVLGWLYQSELQTLRMEMALLLLGGGVFALCQLCYYILVIMRCQKTILKLYLIAALVAVVLSLMLINWTGILGACLSFIFSHIVLLSGYALSIRKELRKTHRKGIVQ